MPFDTAKSLTGVTMMAFAPVLLVVHPSVAAKDLKELLALARARPGYLNYASGGYGTSTHLSAELMKQAAKVFIVHIPYKGTGPAMTDLLAGQVQMQFAGISSARSHVEAGKLRAIAVTGKQRNPAMPGVPTFDESGLAGIDADTYWGLYAPAGVPAAVLSTLHKAFAAALRSPAHAEKLAALGYLPLANTAQEHTQQMIAMIARWTEIIDRGKITAE
jgi:tripartite-type tricarboxylate transporter receptor subunit TctC